MAKKKNFTVMVKVVVDTDVEVSADSFEEALEKVKGYQVTDVVSFEGSHNDSSIEITGVFS